MLKSIFQVAGRVVKRAYLLHMDHRILATRDVLKADYKKYGPQAQEELKDTLFQAAILATATENPFVVMVGSQFLEKHDRIINTYWPKTVRKGKAYGAMIRRRNKLRNALVAGS